MFTDEECVRLLFDSDDMNELRAEVARVSGGLLTVDWETGDPEWEEIDGVRVGLDDRWIVTEAAGLMLWAMRQPDDDGTRDGDDLLDGLWSFLGAAEDRDDEYSDSAT